MLLRRRRLAALLSSVLFVSGSAMAAEALIKPLPQPSLGRLPADQAKNLAEARKAFDEARVTLVGDGLAAAYAQMGVIYARAGINDVAEVALSDAAALAPNDGRWVYLQGVLAHTQKNAAARTYFEHAFQLDPNYVPIRVAFATALMEQNADDRAAKLLDEYLAKNPDQPKVFAMKGEIALKQRRYAEASAALQQALKLDPSADKLYTELAQALQGQGDSAGATAARAKAGNTPPRLADPLAVSLLEPLSSPDAAPVAGSPIEQAAFLMGVGQYPGARAQLDAALKQKPDDVAAMTLYARLEAAAGSAAAAQQRAAAALKLAPNDGLAQLTQGVVMETAGDEAGAKGWYEKAVVSKPDLAEPHLLLGNIAMRQGQYAKAADHYRSVIRLQPTRGEAYAQLAAALTADGHCADAGTELASDLREHPRLPLLVQAFARVAATCRSASADDRKAALERANALYRQLPTSPNAEALALAAAANGKWDDAVQIQGAGIFEVVKGGDQTEIALYKVFFAQLQAKQMPDKPWPPQHPLYHPEALRPLPPPPADDKKQ